MKLSRWLTQAATMMNLGAIVMECRRYPRHATDLPARLSGPNGDAEVRCLDLNRRGANVQTTQAAEIGSLVFMRITGVGLMGFAFVRHCRSVEGQYRLGLEFRDALQRERVRDGGFHRQRLTPELAWDGPEW